MNRSASNQQSQQGFTLLEVMIAFAIIVVIIAAVYTTQGGGLAASARNKNVIIATHLARNLINEEELKYEGLSFDRLPTEKRTQNFTDQHKDFKYTIEYAKVDFSALSELLARAMKSEGEKEEGNSDQTATVMRVFKDYLERSVRRMTVTIEWPEGEGTTAQTFTQLIVNYDEEVKLGI